MWKSWSSPLAIFNTVYDCPMGNTPINTPFMAPSTIPLPGLCQAKLICAVKRAQLWGTAGSYACMYVSWCPGVCPCVRLVRLPVGVPVIRSIKLKRLLMCKPQTRPRPRPSLRLCLSAWQCRSGASHRPINPAPRPCPALATFSNSFGNRNQRFLAQSTFSCSLKCKLDGNEVYILAE